MTCVNVKAAATIQYLCGVFENVVAAAGANMTTKHMLYNSSKAIDAATNFLTTANVTTGLAKAAQKAHKVYDSSASATTIGGTEIVKPAKATLPSPRMIWLEGNALGQDKLTMYNAMQL